MMGERAWSNWYGYGPAAVALGLAAIIVVWAVLSFKRVLNDVDRGDWSDDA